MYVLVSAIYIRLKFLSIYPVTCPGVEKLDSVTPLFLYRNVVFLAQAENLYFSVDFRLK